MNSHTTIDPWVGSRVHRRYLAETLITRDGDLSVYTATDEHMRRPVWLRVHSGPDQGPESGPRSGHLAAAAALRRAQHPNLESVLAFGDTPDGAYVVTERVPGHPLAEELEAGEPMSPNRAFAVLEPVVSALAAAHGARLAHGSLDPGQVFMTDDGRVELAGFGRPDADPGQASQDVLACGTLLHRLLTGEDPGPGRRVPSAAVPGLPGYVDALVTTMTAGDPALRPADAGELLPLVRDVADALLDGTEQRPDLLERIVRVTAASAPPSPSRVVAPAVVARAEKLRARPAVDPDSDARTTSEPAVADVPAQDRRTEPPTAPMPVPEPAPARERTAVEVTPAGRSRRPLWRILLVAVVVLAIAALWVVLRPRDAAEPATVVDPPEVAGMTVSEARRALQQAGLRVELSDERAFSDTVPPGAVAELLVPDGSVSTGDTATLVVSRGPRRPLVPDLAGSDVPAAKRLLHRRELEVGSIVEVVGSDLPAGRVIGTIPAGGSRLAPGTVVALRVSNGQRSFLMPSFVGWELFEARHAALRFSLDIVVGGTGADGDVVLSQTPAPGTVVRGGATLTLVTAR